MRLKRASRSMGYKQGACCPPFETAASRPPQGEVRVCIGKRLLGEINGHRRNRRRLDRSGGQYRDALSGRTAARCHLSALRGGAQEAEEAAHLVGGEAAQGQGEARPA